MVHRPRHERRTRWEALRDVGYRVPNARFFVRNHTATPAIDPTWWLRVFGSGLRGDATVELSLRDLLRMPARRATASIECAGNGRSFFGSQQGAPGPARRGSSARSESPTGRACRSARSSSARASGATPKT